jgi:cell division protein FtsB
VSTRQTVLLSLTIVGLFAFLLVIVFGDKGLADLHLLRLERDRLAQQNARLLAENLVRHEQKQRLENDPRYIAQVVRDELGWVAPTDQVFITPSAAPQPAGVP